MAGNESAYSTYFVHFSDAVQSSNISKDARSRPLWRSFVATARTLTGYSLDDFEFLPGQTTLSTFRAVIMMLVTYYTVILGGREVMRNRKPFHLGWLFKLHNLTLTLASSLMLVLVAEQVIPTVYSEGLYDSICGFPGWTPLLVSLYYLNYITKYIEFIDTVFLVLRKKPLTFLHTYHHGATALLCYTELLGHTSVSWVPISANLFVHVLMYFHYFQSARGIRIWWKRYITQLQITQFVVDLVFVGFVTWTALVSLYSSSIAQHWTCAGESYAKLGGFAILASYLVLFMFFYARTYKQGKSGSKYIRAAVTQRAEGRSSIVD